MNTKGDQKFHQNLKKTQLQPRNLWHMKSRERSKNPIQVWLR